MTPNPALPLGRPASPSADQAHPGSASESAVLVGHHSPETDRSSLQLPRDGGAEHVASLL